MRSPMSETTRSRLRSSRHIGAKIEVGVALTGKQARVGSVQPLSHEKLLEEFTKLDAPTLGVFGGLLVTPDRRKWPT